MRIIAIISLLTSCGLEITTAKSNPCEYTVSGLCIQLEKGQVFKPDLLAISMEQLEAVTNESWPGLDLLKLMERTQSDLFYVTNWKYDEVGYNNKYTIEVQYIDQCHGKYWRPINEIQHTIASIHLGASNEDNFNHDVPGFFVDTDGPSVETQMSLFVLELCWFNSFLGNDY